MQDTNDSVHEQTNAHPATYPRYVVAQLTTGGGYVVYDRWQARVADGRYLSETDAQWAADQRNMRQRQQQWEYRDNG